MNNFHFYFIKLKNYTIPIILLFFTICLVLFSSSNLLAAKSGLSLWATSVVPALFPFFIATELLSKTDIPRLLGKICNKFMKPLFNISGEGSFAFIMGLLSGYPIGAKVACNFRQNNVLSKVECERLLSFTNNSGPLFILGTVGISMFGSSTIGILLFITHFIASITVGFIFRFWKKDSNCQTETNQFHSSFSKSEHKNISISNLGETITESITSATSTIMMIGGLIVLFSVITSILKESNIINILSNFLIPELNLLHIPSDFAQPLMTGFLEITNGISSIAKIQIKELSINIIFTAFLLGFGGISVLLQVLSITSKTDLSIKPYILGKLLHGILAAFYTFLLIQLIPAFNLNISYRFFFVLIILFRFSFLPIYLVPVLFWSHLNIIFIGGAFMEKDFNDFQNNYCFNNMNMQNGFEMNDIYKDPMFNPIMQYEQAFTYYKYLCMQMDYKIKCKEYEKLCNTSSNSQTRNVSS